MRLITVPYVHLEGCTTDLTIVIEKICAFAPLFKLKNGKPVMDEPQTQLYVEGFDSGLAIDMSVEKFAELLEYAYTHQFSYASDSESKVI